MWMKMLLALTTPLLLASTSTDRSPLTFKGLGEIRIGMTIAQLKARDFASDSMYEGQSRDEYDGCHYMFNGRDYPGVGLMINDGRLARIDIDKGRDIANAKSNGIYKPIPVPAWQSHSGAKIGMSEKKIKAIYGRWLKISGHPYLGEAGSYLRLDSSDGKYAMIFETAVNDMGSEVLEKSDKEKFVTDFRAGLADAVSYIEGCA